MPPLVHSSAVETSRMNASEQQLRDAALAHLQTFCKRILPGTIRRIAAWKRLPSGQLPDLLEDLHQELALDCLDDPAVITQLSPAARNTRWMRLAERWIYHHHVRGRATEEVHEQLPAPQLPHADSWPQPLLESGITLTNGRWNMVASAARCGRRLANVRHDLDQLVSRLGCDREYDRFWRTRLAEAMTGLAADLLCDRLPLHVLPRTRRRPDPRQRLRRIRSIGARFHVRQSTIDVRRMLRPWLRRPQFDEQAPQRLLLHAVTLAPQAPSAWLWLFEASLVQEDLRSAIEALRGCRSTGHATRTAVTLARARVLEARGRWSAALALLQRAAARWPQETSLVRVHRSQSPTGESPQPP